MEDNNNWAGLLDQFIQFVGVTGSCALPPTNCSKGQYTSNKGLGEDLQHIVAHMGGYQPPQEVESAHPLPVPFLSPSQCPCWSSCQVYCLGIPQVFVIINHCDIGPQNTQWLCGPWLFHKTFLLPVHPWFHTPHHCRVIQKTARQGFELEVESLQNEDKSWSSPVVLLCYFPKIHGPLHSQMSCGLPVR